MCCQIVANNGNEHISNVHHTRASSFGSTCFSQKPFGRQTFDRHSLKETYQSIQTPYF
jgi:hypothetical protein